MTRAAMLLVLFEVALVRAGVRCVQACRWTGRCSAKQLLCKKRIVSVKVEIQGAKDVGWGICHRQLTGWG